EPERLVLIDWKGEPLATGWGSGNLMSYPMCRDLQQQKDFFNGVLCRHPTTINLATDTGSIPVADEVVSSSYFSVLGVSTALGRLFDSADNQAPGADPSVVLAYGFWKGQFAGRPDVIGQKITVNRYPMTIIGVAGEGFRGVDIGEIPAVWIPAAMKAQ